MSSIIYKALSEIYEQPIKRKKSLSRSSRSYSAGRSSGSIRSSVVSGDQRSLGSSERARSVALLSRSKNSTRAGIFPLLSSETILRQGRSQVRSHSSTSSSFSYTKRNESGNLLAIGPSNYKIIGFENGDHSIKSPISPQEGERLSRTNNFTTPIQSTSIDEPISFHTFHTTKLPSTSITNSDEIEFSPLIEEAAQLKVLVAETLALADSHFSPVTQNTRNIGSTHQKGNKIALQDSIDESLSSGAQEILSLLAAIQVRTTEMMNDNHIPAAVQVRTTEMTNDNHILETSSDSVLPPVDDVLNDDEEIYMRSRAIRLR
jgi:hypothetical protein